MWLNLNGRFVLALMNGTAIQGETVILEQINKREHTVLKIRIDADVTHYLFKWKISIK